MLKAARAVRVALLDRATLTRRALAAEAAADRARRELELHQRAAGWGPWV